MPKQDSETEKPKVIECLAIKMTKTHCKGVVYNLLEAEANKGIADGFFQPVIK